MTLSSSDWLESPGGLGRTWVAGSISTVSNPVGLGSDLKTCNISNEFPGNAAVLGTPL